MSNYGDNVTSSPTAGMDASKPHILVVDDEMSPRESLKMILNPYYTVHVADHGAEAVEMLGKFPVDLVTLDLKMPGLSGIHVLEKLKEYDPDIEAIIITGHSSQDTAIQGLRLGAFDYIAKPFDVQSYSLSGSPWSRAAQRQDQVKRDQIVFSPLRSYGTLRTRLPAPIFSPRSHGTWQTRLRPLQL